MYQIGEVAKLAKVTIRLLHHYDDIGLLAPSGRSEAGYRFYSQVDLQRLQQILFYRALEFPLEQILALMNNSGFDRHAALKQQRELLLQKSQQLDGLVALIDRTISEIETPEEQQAMSTKEMFEVFPDMNQEYLDEARARWGDTDAWKESARRSARYTKADWVRMKQEMNQVNAGLEAVFSAGKPATSVEAIAAVEQARLLIDRWHYDCSKEFHANLTVMTSQDERFVKNIDKNCAGLAVWIHQATLANLAQENDTGQS